MNDTLPVLNSVLVALAMAIGLSIGFVDIKDVQACDPAMESVQWTVPEDGDVVAPETTFIFAVGGYFTGDDVITIVDGDDNEIEGQHSKVSMARLFSGMREFVPDEPLAAGEYTVRVDYEETTNFPETESLEMTVTVDEAFEAPSAPDAVAFDWFHETHDEEQGDSCFFADEIYHIAVQPLADEPAYYEVILEHGDGSESLQLLAADADGGALRRYEITDVECVSVVARLIDGSGGEVNRVCQPHKCKHYEGETNQTSLGFTEWEEVSGCNEEGAGEETEEQTEGATQGETQEETEGGSCATASGSMPPAWMILLVVLGLVIQKKTRGQCSL